MSQIQSRVIFLGLLRKIINFPYCTHCLLALSCTNRSVSPATNVCGVLVMTQSSVLRVTRATGTTHFNASWTRGNMWVCVVICHADGITVYSRNVALNINFIFAEDVCLIFTTLYIYLLLFKSLSVLVEWTLFWKVAHAWVKWVCAWENVLNNVSKCSIYHQNTRGVVYKDRHLETDRHSMCLRKNLDTLGNN